MFRMGKGMIMVRRQATGYSFCAISFEDQPEGKYPDNHPCEQILKLNWEMEMKTLLGFLLAWWFYIKSPETPRKLAASLSGPYKLLSGKYFIDELYAAAIVRPLVWISDKVLWHVIDERAIDGTVNGVATVSRETGDRLRRANTGNIRSYATWIVLGVLVFTSLLLWMVD